MGNKNTTQHKRKHSARLSFLASHKGADRNASPIFCPGLTPRSPEDLVDKEMETAKKEQKKKGQSQDEENLECKSAGAGRKVQLISRLERRAQNRPP